MMWRFLGVLSILGLSACTISVNQDQIFRPNEANRRPDLGSIERQDELPENVSLLHDYLPSAAGNIAITLAQTNNNRLIVACMGNAADRLSDGVGYLKGLVPFGDVVIFDYPGYGDSSGTPALDDFDAALLALKTWVDAADYEEIVVWGHSLGGFVCAELTSQLAEKPDAFVFETSASSVAAVAAATTPWYAKPFIRIEIEEGLSSYDNIEALNGFAGHVLVIGASEDKQLPVGLSRELADKLKEAGRDVTYVELDGAGHMNVSSHPEYPATISRFTDDLTR